MLGVRKNEGQSNFITKEICSYCRAVASERHISLDEVLSYFYHSEVYQLMREGISDMHCMSDEYLIEELEAEYRLENIR